MMACFNAILSCLVRPPLLPSCGRQINSREFFIIFYPQLLKVYSNDPGYIYEHTSTTCPCWCSSSSATISLNWLIRSGMAPAVLLGGLPRTLPAIESYRETGYHHSSECIWFGAARCEQYCRNQAGQGALIDHMERCDWLSRKICCCII